MGINGLLEIIAVYRIGDDLDESISKNLDYQEALVRQRKSFYALDKLGLTEGQTRVVNQAIAENNHCGAIYGAVTYRFGMEDGIRLRMEMEEIMNFPQ